MPVPANLSSTAFLIADAARAAMLTALVDGSARPAIELAQGAGVTPQTASKHEDIYLKGYADGHQAKGRHRGMDHVLQHRVPSPSPRKPVSQLVWCDGTAPAPASGRGCGDVWTTLPRCDHIPTEAADNCLFGCIIGMPDERAVSDERIGFRGPAHRVHFSLPREGWMLQRRNVLSVGLGLAASTAFGQGKAFSQAPLEVGPAASDGSGASREVSEVFEAANDLSIGPAGPRAAGPSDPLDIADIVKRALEHEDNEDDVALATRAGILLSEVTRDRREAPAYDPTEPQPAKPHPYATMKAYYQKLYTSAQVKPQHAGLLRSIASRIMAAKDRYVEVENDTGVPWFVIGPLHYREANLNFMGHLHNGDPLLMRTYHVPPNRPPKPWPAPGKSLRDLWRTSAVDALSDLRKRTNSWSVQSTCWAMEGYNGFGCFDHGINSPYLWNFTDQYTAGGYPLDGHYKDTYVSKQAGLFSILLTLRGMDPSVDDIFHLDG